MAPVNIKYVVSFSSQDDYHRAGNLITSDGFKRWLSSKKDRSGKIELILQLEEPCQFAYIDIGAIWCATLEVRVGRSDWPQSMEFKSLIPSVSLMSPVDCRLSRATTSTQMFSKKDFSEQVASEKWDRVQVICRQPFRKDIQFGLSFIRIKNVNPKSPKDIRENSGPALGLSEGDKSKQNISSIQKHFFGESLCPEADSGNQSDTLKYRLLKIAASAEGGCEQEQALSRTAQLVLKATENSKAYSPHQRHASPLPKRGLFSEHVAKKQDDIPIEEEIRSFLPSLNISTMDIDTVNVSDLRHKFEKKKRRKLTREEKRTFSELCQDFICELFDEGSDGTVTKLPNTLSSDNKMQVQRKMLEAGSNHSHSCKKIKSGVVSESSVPVSACENRQSCVTTPPQRKCDNDSVRKDLPTLHQSSKNGIINRQSSTAPSISSPCRTSVANDSHLTSSLSVTPCGKNLTSSKIKDLPRTSVIQSSPPVTQCANDPVKLSQTLQSSTPSESSVILQKSSLYLSSALQGSHKGSSSNTTLKNHQHSSAPNTCRLTLKRSVASNSSHSLLNVNKDSVKKGKNASEQENEIEADSSSEDETDGAKIDDADSLSAVSYDESDSEHENNTSKVFAHGKLLTPSTHTPGTKITREGVKRAYENLYNPVCQDEANVSSDLSAEQEGGPAKRRKLNQGSLALIQEFDTELISSDDDEVAYGEKPCKDQKIVKGKSLKFLPLLNIENSSVSIEDPLALRSSPIDNSSTKVSSSKPTSHCGGEIQENRTPKSARGKIYRMYESRSNTVTKPMDNRAVAHNPNVTSPINKQQDRLPGNPDLNQSRLELVSPDAQAPAAPSSVKQGSGQRRARGFGANQRSDGAADDIGDGPGRRSRGRGRKSRGQGSATRKKGKNSDTSSIQDQVFCEKCYGLYSSDTFPAHYAFCIPPASHMESRDQDTSMGPQTTDSTHELLIDETVDYAECPICMQRFPQDVLLVHASECGI